PRTGASHRAHADAISYHFKDGANAAWTAIQVRNARYPIAKLEAMSGVTYGELPGFDYNFFVKADGLCNGPCQLRVTHQRGQVVEDSWIARAWRAKNGRIGTASRQQRQAATNGPGFVAYDVHGQISTPPIALPRSPIARLTGAPARRTSTTKQPVGGVNVTPCAAPSAVRSKPPRTCTGSATGGSSGHRPGFSHAVRITRSPANAASAVTSRTTCTRACSCVPAAPVARRCQRPPSRHS